MNFGILEVAPSSLKAAPAPGWAYVPEITNAQPQQTLQASSRRARGLVAGLNAPDAVTQSKKQDARILRELLVLERENHRDVAIPVQTKGRAPPSKTTPAVRKILASQKIFANHLADYEALASLPGASTSSTSTTAGLPQAPAVTNPQVPTPGYGLTSAGKRSHKRKEPIPPTAENTPVPKRSHKKKDPNAPAISTPLRQSLTPAPKIELPPASISIPFTGLSLVPLTEPKPHPRDNDPLLMSRVPRLPSNEEIQRLLAMPPLSYNEARGGWSKEDRRRPGRVFCEVCGYWGRVRCLRCGGRVCALECLGTHKEECFARYGA